MKKKYPGGYNVVYERYNLMLYQRCYNDTPKEREVGVFWIFEVVSGCWMSLELVHVRYYTRVLNDDLFRGNGLATTRNLTFTRIQRCLTNIREFRF